MSGAVGADQPAGSGTIARNVCAGLLAAVGGVMAPGLLTEGPALAGLSAIVGAAVALLLTSPGKSWRLRRCRQANDKLSPGLGRRVARAGEGPCNRYPSSVTGSHRT
jgi:hypothetical protein